MNKAILYLFRGEEFWMVSLRGIPEDEDLAPGSRASSSTIVPTDLPRDVDVETAFRKIQAQNPTSEVRILNWNRPKRDV